MAYYGLSSDISANPDKNVILYVPGQTKLTPQDVFLGGPGTGVDDKQLNGATRVFGNTADGTRAALNHYESDLFSQTKAAQANNAAPRTDSYLGMPTIQRQQMEINQAQNKIGNDQNSAQLTGYYNGTPTLAQKTYDHNVNQDNFSNAYNVGNMLGMYNGQQTLAGRQLDASVANDKAQLAASLARSSSGGSSSGSMSAALSAAKYQNELGSNQALAQSMQGLQQMADNGSTRSEILKFVNSNAGDLQANGVPIQDLYKWASTNFTWDKDSSGSWYDTKGN